MTFKRLPHLRFLQVALIALAIAATGYAVLFGRLLPALLIAAATTLAATLLLGGRRERDSRLGGRSAAEPAPDSSKNGRDRRSEMVIPWVLASTVGGAVGGLGFVLQFFGQLVLFGGVLGLAQWLVLLRYLERAGWWVSASFFGWFAGSVAGMLATPATAGASATTGLMLGFGAWAGLGAFQGLALYGLLGAVPGRRKLVSLWLAVSVIGGVVAEVVAYLASTALPEEAAADLLPKGLAAIVLGHAGAGAVYGAATGVALAEVLRRRGGGRGDHRAAAETGPARPSARPGSALRRGATATAAGLLALISLGAVGVLLFRAGTCGQEERTAYGELAQYGGRRLAPEPNYELGSCQAFYLVDDRPKEVLAYFGDRLRVNGWKVEMIFQPPPSAPPGSSTSFVARRGDYRYSFIFYPSEGYGAPAPGGKVAIDVYED